jgi:hypothetical protein
MNNRLFAVPKLIFFLDNRGPVAGLSLLDHGLVVFVMLPGRDANTVWPHTNTDVVGKRGRCNGANHSRSDDVRSHFAFLLYLLSEQNAAGHYEFRFLRQLPAHYFRGQRETIDEEFARLNRMAFMGVIGAALSTLVSPLRAKAATNDSGPTAYPYGPLSQAVVPMRLGGTFGDVEASSRAFRDWRKAAELAGVVNFLSDPNRPIDAKLRAMMTTAHLGDAGPIPSLLLPRGNCLTRARTSAPAYSRRNVVSRALSQVTRRSDWRICDLVAGEEHIPLLCRATVRWLILTQIGRRLTKDLHDRDRPTSSS